MSYHHGVVLAYLKPSNRCNIGCTHCYLPESVRADASRMNRETLEGAAVLLRDMATTQRKQPLIIFHGGEPLNVPLEWYQEAFPVLDGVFADMPHSEGIQTSLIPYRSEHANMIHERMGSQIGSSIDFSQRAIRSAKGGVRAYQVLWLRKVAMARADGLLVTPSFVPSKNELGKEREIIEWFVGHGFERVGLDRYNSWGRDDPDRPTNREHSRFLIALFDEVMRRAGNDEPVPVIPTLIAGIAGVLHGQPGDRWGTHCQSEFLVAEPNGNLNTCPDRSTREEAFGNVGDMGSGAEQPVFFSHPARRAWVRKQQMPQSGCLSCEYHSWCGSGCPITNHEDECAGYRAFLAHVDRYRQTELGSQTLEQYLEMSR